MESRGVTADSFELLAFHIDAIIGTWQTDIPQSVFSFLAAIHTARDLASDAAGYIDCAEPFTNFFALVFPSYVATVTANTSYYLSDLELVALCRCQRTSVVILLHNLDDDTMQYHSHSFSPFDNGVRWVAIETLAGGNSVRNR